MLLLRRNIAFLLIIHPELDQSPEFHWMSDSQGEHRHYGHDGGVKGGKVGSTGWRCTLYELLKLLI